MSRETLTRETDIEAALSKFYCAFHKVKKINVQDDFITYTVNPFNDFDYREAQRIIEENNLPLKATLHGSGLFKTNLLTISAK